MDPSAPSAPSAPRRPLDETLHALLASFGVRLFLSACIIVSLLPFPWVHHLDGLFLLIFGAEFFTRLLALFRGPPGEPEAPEEVESGDPEGGGGRPWRLPTPGDPGEHEPALDLARAPPARTEGAGDSFPLDPAARMEYTSTALLSEDPLKLL